MKLKWLIYSVNQTFHVLMEQQVIHKFIKASDLACFVDMSYPLW